MTHRLPNAVSRTELGYLDGVTSAIQTQIDGKLSTGGGTLTGSLTLTNATFSGVVSAPVGSETAPSFTFTNDPNTGMYSTADMLRLTAGGIEQARFFTYGIPVLQTDGTIQSISYSGTQTGNANVATFTGPSAGGAYSSNIVAIDCVRSGSTAYKFINCRSASTGTPDTEFYVRGDGATFADGAYTGTGADYAEYFEWDDGNTEGEDRRGITVTLVENKIMPASEGDIIIGVVSAAPTIVGDAAHERWAGKYLKDDYGTYLTDENDERILNEEWNEDLEYISREFRPEWDCIGLAGKLRVRKGQPVDQRWVKMRDISEDVEEWLVR